MYILSLDQGTTSSRAILFDQEGQIAFMAQREYKQHYPQKSWVEHDPMEILNSQLEVTIEVLLNAKAGEVAAMGITNQRETVVAWNKEDGKPIYNAIVWQDQRTAEYCSKLRDQGHQEMIKSKTGLMIDPYFSATKMRWILQNVKGAQKLADDEKLALGTIDSWLLWNLTGEHLTDVSNASRTMLMDLSTEKYDSDLLDLFEIPESCLATIVSSDHEFGMCEIGAHDLSIEAVIGDQQAALFGQQCWAEGEVKNTYGTGCFMLMNTGETPAFSDSGLLTTVGWRRNDTTTFALEGSVFVAGAAIQWLRDEVELLDSAEDSESAVQKAKEEGVYVVPAFAGLGTPHWDDKACGAIFGLTRSTNKYDIIKATLDSLAYQNCDLLKAMAADSNLELKSVRVDGGASANNYLMQFQSDLLNIRIERPLMLESTAWGAALMAGLSVGFWEDDELASLRLLDEEFQPEMNKEMRQEKLAGWEKSVNRSKLWYD